MELTGLKPHASRPVFTSGGYKAGLGFSSFGWLLTRLGAWPLPPPSKPAMAGQVPSHIKSPRLASLPLS